MAPARITSINRPKLNEAILSAKNWPRPAHAQPHRAIQNVNKYGEEEEEGEEEEAKKEIGHSRALPNSVSLTHDSSCPQDDHKISINIAKKG